MADHSTAIELLLKAKDETGEAFDSLKEKLEGVKGIMEKAFVWKAGEMVFDKVKEGVEEFVGGLIGANANVETLRTSLTGLYGNATEAGQAIEYMTSFSLKSPFAKDDILAAGQSIASFGQDITKVLPALGNVAATMGVDLPTAASALEKAVQTGSLRGLTSTLHITKAELLEFGAQTTKTGALLQSSILPAFERLSDAKFGSGMSSQLNTFNGAMTNLKNQFDNLMEVVGKPIFEVLERGLAGVVRFLSANQAAISHFGDVLGRGLGAAANVAAAAFSFVGDVIRGFASWFTGSALPVIETGIGMIAVWWRQNGAAVQQAVSAIWNRVREFANLLVSGLAQAWNIASAEIKYFWDNVSMVFTLGQDAITGHWSRFGLDFANGVRRLAADAIGIFAAMLTTFVDLITRLAYSVAEGMVPVANNLLAPMTWVAQKFRDVFIGLGDLIGAFIGAMAKVGDEMAQPFIDGVNKIIGALKSANDQLEGMSVMGHNLGLGFGAIQHMSFVKGLNPDADAAGAQNDISSFFRQHAPGLSHDQQFSSGQSVAQAQAGLEKDRKNLVAPFDAFVNGIADQFKQQLDPAGPAAKKTKDAAQATGKGIIENLFGGLFGGVKGDLGGAEDLPSLANSNLGDGSIPALAKALKTPVKKTSGTSDGSAGGSGGGRSPLGDLGAAFGQIKVSGGPLHAGTSAAERLQQRQAQAAERTVDQGIKQTDLLQKATDLLASASGNLERLARTAVQNATPHPHPINEAQALGVARPVRP